MFETFPYTIDQIKRYYEAGVRDYKLALTAEAPELVFYVCYNVVIKIAIAICAKNNLRVKSQSGHHAELINKLAEILGDNSILDNANRMRRKRNLDLYGGGLFISNKEAEKYQGFCRHLLDLADSYLFPGKML